MAKQQSTKVFLALTETQANHLWWLVTGESCQVQIHERHRRSWKQISKKLSDLGYPVAQPTTTTKGE